MSTVTHRLTTALLLGALGVASGLGCDGGGEGVQAAVPDVLADAATDAPAAPEVTAPAASTSKLVVLDRLGFAPETSPGVGDGFDLDGRVSGPGDPGGCFEPDLVSPAGLPGVDNKLGTLLPLFAVAGIGAADALLQNSVDEGGLLLMMQIDGVDDLRDDDSVTITVRTGQGKPLMATDGLILPGQTFHLRPDSPDTRTESGRIEGGILTAGPVDTWLRVRVLGLDYELPVHGAWIRGRVTEEGGLADGVIGAGVAITDLQKIGDRDSAVGGAMELLFAEGGDLAPDATGACQQVSASLAFTAVSAFLFEDPEP
ncbi:MAG: hypothetical protein H6746_20850 [Deltaproteobacteria bacterium]|nr:hypothetical protein [Deltaproteobacteria bacterium]